MRRDPAVRTLTMSDRGRRAFRRGWRTASGLALVAATVASATGCTSRQKSSLAPSYMIIQSIQAASGAQPDKLGGTLDSDVLTLVKQTVNNKEVYVPTVYGDPAQVTFKLALKDPGTANQPVQPSSTNYITITRYHVQFVRADGRNTPGVDVPYPFDGGITATVTADGATTDFTLVRTQAKEEAPLLPLVGGGGAITISTIAEVTFYGTDQAGHDVTATGQISVNFADWGDPQ